MKNLLPGSALRRSETHIARQIFSALTRVNEENGELEADIAHHWQQLTPTHWRFFLRPGIHFHHGRELEMADVIASLQRSNALPLYTHIERIESPTARPRIFICASPTAGCHGCWGRCRRWCCRRSGRP